MIEAVLVIGWASLVTFLFQRYTQAETNLRAKLWLFSLVATITLGIGGVIEYEKSLGPCLRQETTLVYNSTTKTMQPYVYCAERGNP